MKNLLPPALSVCLFVLMLVCARNNRSLTRNRPEKDGPAPSDYLYLQRAFPYDAVPSEAYYAAVDQARSRATSRGNAPEWELAGPTSVGGRITDVAMHASDLQTIYAATASGGVWKSPDAGETWAPVTDDLPSLSIGDIAIDPSDKNTIYCGTGETNGGGGSVTYDGRGVFKSTDGGSTWASIGLESTGSIGRIEVDPENPDRIFVAAMGHLFENNPERGVYRSLDGGQTWDKTLYINDSTGVIDLVVHPTDPDTVFAVSWQRTRRPNARRYGGPGCGIWRSTDGGDTWAKLSGNGFPASNNTLGRIGIAAAPTAPGTLYAICAQESGPYLGTFKSTDNGDNWTSMTSFGSDPGYSSFGWWFGQIRVDPTNAARVYSLGVDWIKSLDGGTSWGDVSPYLHADYHALYIHPANPQWMVAGNDGGVYISPDGGATWTHRPFPITQFYTSEIDFQNPTNLYGGAQDNGTWRTLDGTLDNWETFYGGDGFVTLVNPENDAIYYAEFQYGNLYGSNDASAPSSQRYNWNTPYVFDPANPDIMYIGAERLYRSNNGGLDWVPFSPDLSNGPTGSGGVVYGTVSSIAVSPLDPKIVLAGTDDGNVWVTANGGTNWSKISAALPKRWITRVVADLWDKNTIYVCLSGFRHADDMAHIYKSTNLGQNWTEVAGDLPDIPVNDMILDPEDPSAWYVATDAGVFATYSGGANWEPFGINLPNVPILDLTLHAPTRTLAAATYGRSMFKTTLPLSTAAKIPEIIDNVRIAPNPACQVATLSFALATAQDVRIEAYDSGGRLVRVLFSGKLPAGENRLALDASGIPAGVYLINMRGQNGAPFCRKWVVGL